MNYPSPVKSNQTSPFKSSQFCYYIRSHVRSFNRLYLAVVKQWVGHRTIDTISRPANHYESSLYRYHNSEFIWLPDFELKPDYSRLPALKGMSLAGCLLAQIGFPSFRAILGGAVHSHPDSNSYGSSSVTTNFRKATGEKLYSG